MEKNGEILCAHCTCMAGLGEACSNISALLFTAEANTQFRNDTSCTSTICSWTAVKTKKCEYAHICKIVSNTVPLSTVYNQEPTEKELQELYRQLSECKKNPAIIPIVPGFCDMYVP